MSDADNRLVAVLGSIPYARFLGVTAELAGDEMTAILPFADHIVGNPMLPAIHGGVLGAFMEMTALAQLSVAAPLKRQPRTVDVSIEYLRSGRPLTTYARATIKKLGRHEPGLAGRPKHGQGRRQGRAQGRSAVEALPGLWSAVHLAQEVGSGLGGSEILLRSLQIT